MMDQRSKFLALGLKAEIVGQAQQDRAAEQKVLNGEFQVVFITPESIILREKFREMLLTPEYK
jgi:superfamily II DNA helicase RecQ